MLKKFTLVCSFICALATTASAQITDGSFEAGSGSGNWTEASTNFGTPICSEALCGNGNGTCFPNTGTYYIWFGGVDGFSETGSVEQSVVFDEGTSAYLKMMVNIAGVGDSLANDRIELSIDGTVVKTITAQDVAAYTVYTLDSTDVSAYADGASHVVKIEGFQTTGTIFNILVDDVELTINDLTSVLFPEEMEEAAFLLYPNEADDYVNLEFRAISGKATISLTSLNGAIISQETVDNVSGRILTYDTSNLEAGVYLVNVSNKNGMTTEKLVVMH